MASRTTQPGAIEMGNPYESVAILEFCGFKTETATEIFTQWTSLPPGHTKLIDFVYQHIEVLEQPDFEDLAPEAAMDQLGLSAEIKSALLDPNFRQMFGSETLHFWIRDTIGLRYGSYGTYLQKQERKRSEANTNSNPSQTRKTN